MPEITEKEAIEIFEKAHSLQEQLKMESHICDIDCILSQNPVNMNLVKAKIEKINDEHKENILINHIIFPPQRTAFLGRGITDTEYIFDLRWKRAYLQAKKDGKAFDEFCKEMRKNAVRKD